MKDQISKPKRYNRQPDYLKLSRMGDELSRMLSELHSYRCEPCTPAMHDQYIDLNDSGRELKQFIEQTTSLIQDPINLSATAIKEVNQATKKYQSFQKNLSSYFTEVIVHH